MRNRSELDRFGTGADDKGDARAGQLRVSNSGNPARQVMSRIMAERKLARGQKGIIAV